MVCFGADEAAKTLAKAWGHHVAKPLDVKSLVQRAYGEHVTVNVKLSRNWRRSTVEVKGLDFESLALLVLGKEMLVESTPADVAQTNWGLPVG